MIRTGSPQSTDPNRLTTPPWGHWILLATALLAASAAGRTSLAQSREIAELPAGSPALQTLAQASPMPSNRAEPRADVPDKPVRPMNESIRRDAEPKPADPPSTGPSESSSAAERIARLRRSLESDSQRLDELRNSILSSDSEYAKSEEEFKEVDRRVQELKSKLAQARDDKDQEAESSLEVSHTEALAIWQQSKRRFEKAIAERKTANETIRNLEEKSRLEREALDKLLGVAPASPPKESLTSVERPAHPATSTDATARPATGAAALPAVPKTSGHDLLASLPPGILPASVAVPNGANATTSAPPAPQKSPSPPNRALQEAHVVAQQMTVAAQQAQQEVQSLTERIDLLRRNIESERRLRDAAQQRADESESNSRLLTQEIQTAIAEGRDPIELGRKQQEAEQRNREARDELRRTSIHLDELQTEYARMQSDRIAALEEAQTRWDEADAAQRRVESLSDPFAPRNIWEWLITHGLRVLGIAMLMIMVLWVSRAAGRRLIQFMMVRGLAGTEQEKANRANTLAAVLHNALHVATILLGVVTILNEIGVPVGPVMGGAAVLGLAVAFGAQSLIKDYFTGFMLLLEQQYFINDVVKIGDVSGQVEQISLRMTVLRDQEGQAHFIPHGTIGSVTNMTYNWSRAVIDISVSYDDDVDQVIEELNRIAQGLRVHPDFGRLILEEPTMLGVDAFGDSGVRVKFLLKTRPQQQWAVKREMLRRIKKRFDELGIRIPYPHTTVHLHQESPTDASRSSPLDNTPDDDHLEAA